MSLSSEFFSAFLNARLEASDVYVPLNNAAYADLLDILSESGSYIILTIQSEWAIETVKARNESGTIILDRGFAGTKAVLHHFGSCVSSVTPTVLAVIKDLVCNYKCCEDTDCPCAAVEFVGATLPPGYAGKEWIGSAVFSGDLPINIVANNTPDWMQVNHRGNLLQFSGTPVAAGAYTFSIAATNCNGVHLVSRDVSVIIAN